jgi:hypothetical protein
VSGLACGQFLDPPLQLLPADVDFKSFCKIINRRQMSKFVNYKKRDISLPGGCKDLMDVITQGKTHVSLSHFHNAAHELPEGEGKTILGTIADIPKYVLKALGPSSGNFVLMIQSPNHWLAVNIQGLGIDTVSAFVWFPDDPERKKIVQAFFQHHSLEVPNDTEVLAQFLFPDQPVTLTFAIKPEPGDAQGLANLTMDLFRHCCASGENPEMHFLLLTGLG